MENPDIIEVIDVDEFEKTGLKARLKVIPKLKHSDETEALKKKIDEPQETQKDLVARLVVLENDGQQTAADNNAVNESVSSVIEGICRIC